MFVSMMEHRSSDRRAGSSRERASHNSNHHRHYINRHSNQQQQQQQQLLQQQQIKLLLENNKFETKTQSFPVLQIENQLKNKAKIPVVGLSKNNNQYLENNKILQVRKPNAKDGTKDKNSKPESNYLVKEFKYRNKSAFSRDPYDRITLTSDLNNISQKPINNKTEPLEKIKKNKIIINNKNNVQNSLNLSNANEMRNGKLQNGFTKEDLVQRKISTNSNITNIKPTVKVSNIIPKKKSAVYLSFPTLLDEVELKNDKHPLIRQEKIDLNKNLLKKKILNEDYNKNFKEDNGFKVQPLNNNNYKKLSKNYKMKVEKSPLETLHNNLQNLGSCSDESENEKFFTNARLSPSSPTVNSKFKTNKKLSLLTSNKKNIKENEEELKNDLLNINLLNTDKKKENLIVDDTENYENRMAKSVIQLQNPSPYATNSFPFIRSSNVLQNSSSHTNSSSMDLFSSSSGCAYTNHDVMSALTDDNKSLTNINKFNNFELKETSPPFRLERRDHAIAQIYESLVLESPQISRRKKLLMRLRNDAISPKDQILSNLSRSKSQSRANLNLTANKLKKENAKELQNAFLVNRSKTSVNLSSVMSTFPSSLKTAHFCNIRPNFVARKRNISTQRVRLISNDQYMILGIFDPVENDRRRAMSRDYAKALSRNEMGFDVAQQEIKAFSRLKELGIGKTRVLRIADLPSIEQIHSLQIIKKYKNFQRPKKKALHEYYNDDDAELEAMAKVIDSNAPKPTGSLITPVRGDFPSSSINNSGRSCGNQTPKTIDSILYRYGTTQPKAVAGVVLDMLGKPSVSITYGKLLSRATKIAHVLLTKQVTIITSGVKEKVHLCLPGDRVALVYPNTEPLAFLTAFYGCLLAGVVPVPIEVPLTKRDAGIQQFGFLLGICGARVALTSEACFKGLPKIGNQTFLSQTINSSPGFNGTNLLPATFTNTTSSGGLSNFYHHNNNSFPSSTTGSGSSANGGNLNLNGNYYNHYSSSTNPNDVAEFKGWPRLHWTITENLPKPSKDWTLPSLLVNDEHAYIEYTTDREGSIKGVCVSRQAMINHCRAIASVMGYKEGETIVCVVDFKRDVGLWYSILAGIYSGMKIHFVPYSLMKINPTSWLTQASKFQALAALVKSRDLHWSLMAAKGFIKDTQNKDVLNLTELKAIVVADGANPWSLSSCDQFLAMFKQYGLRADALCPCAGSSETGIVSLRRPTLNNVVNNTNQSNGITASSNGQSATVYDEINNSQQTNNQQTTFPRSGRGILSMLALSHSVVRVDQENSLTSLTLQDAGQVIPGGMVVVIKPVGLPKLCKVDEVGEICLHAPSTASCYLGLKGISQQTFAVSPLGLDEKPVGPVQYVRSGLIGFLGPNGLIFVIGNKSAMLSVSGRQHSLDDIIATVLAVEPMKFVYRGRIAVFSVNVLRDERIVVVAEQKPEINEEDAFNWMVRVLHAIDSIHQVGIYCLALLLPNQLSKTPLGGIHVTETRQRFIDGCLHPTTVLMCPQNCVLNLPKPREPHSHDVGPAAMFVGNIVQGARIAGAQGRELTYSNNETIYLTDILRQRATQTPDHTLFTMVNSKGIEIDSLSCQQLLKKAERIGSLLLDKGRLNAGDHVALIFPPGLELILAFYGCLTVGLIPVCIRAPSPTNLQASLITVRMVVDVSKSVALLSNSTMIKLLKSKEASSHRLNTKAWPTILDIDEAPSSSVARRQKAHAGLLTSNENRKLKNTCYLDFSVSTTGQLAGVIITHLGAAMQCKSLKVACELYPSRNLTLCLDPYCGLGFTLWCLSSVYSGHHSTLISPIEIEQNSSIWLNIISNKKIRDTFCSYSVMEMCVRELAPQIQLLKEKGINLSCVRTCVVVAEERPRVQLCNAFIKMLAPLGLSSRAVSTSFGARVNSAICMQGASSPDPSTLYVDARALRNDRVTMVEKGAPHSIALMESGKFLPGVKVVIANPETRGQCADSHLGEIWVSSTYNAAGYFSIFGEETHLHTDHFNAKLTTGDTKTVFARTGYLGFLHQTQSVTADGELHDAVFVVGALDETLMLRGMRYHPCDIETTVIRSHKRICESAVFTWTHLLVVVAETDAAEAEALDLVPAITSAVLEEQHLIVGVVMIIDPATIPINSRGEKQRMHLRDAFLKDQLDPIYVAYNM